MNHNDNPLQPTTELSAETSLKDISNKRGNKDQAMRNHMMQLAGSEDQCGTAVEPEAPLSAVRPQGPITANSKREEELAAGG